MAITDKSRLNIQDVSMRDGMHALRHQMSLDDVARIAGALDRAGVDALEQGHLGGAGLDTLNGGPCLTPVAPGAGCQSPPARKAAIFVPEFKMQKAETPEERPTLQDLAPLRQCTESFKICRGLGGIF